MAVALKDIIYKYHAHLLIAIENHLYDFCKVANLRVCITDIYHRKWGTRNSHLDMS